MHLETEFAYAQIAEPTESCGAATNAAKAMVKELSNVNEVYVLEELVVKDSNNFGKGYGKEIFQKVLSEITSPLIIIPFAVYIEAEAYAGRIAMDDMEAMEQGPVVLEEKFYIPQIQAAGKTFQKLRTEGGLDFLVVTP